jgi:hypothetical protein
MAKKYPQAKDEDCENFSVQRNEEKLGFKVQKLT